MEAKDSRIKIINEIIAGVKVEFITLILSLEYYPCREKVGPNSFCFSYIGGSRQSSQGLLSFFFFYSFCVTLFALANQLLPYRIPSHRLDEWRRLGQWIPFTGFSWLPAVAWLNLCPTPSTFIVLLALEGSLSETLPMGQRDMKFYNSGRVIYLPRKKDWPHTLLIDLTHMACMFKTVILSWR